MEQKLLNWCVQYVFDLCEDDVDTREWVLKDTGIPEDTLTQVFQTLKERLGE